MGSAGESNPEQAFGKLDMGLEKVKAWRGPEWREMAGGKWVEGKLLEQQCSEL